MTSTTLPALTGTNGHTYIQLPSSYYFIDATQLVTQGVLAVSSSSTSCYTVGASLLAILSMVGISSITSGQILCASTTTAVVKPGTPTAVPSNASSLTPITLPAVITTGGVTLVQMLSGYPVFSDVQLWNSTTVNNTTYYVAAAPGIYNGTAFAAGTLVAANTSVAPTFTGATTKPTPTPRGTPRWAR